MSDYKKRDKGDWNQGKKYKGTRKAKEREHTKKEVQQQINEQKPEFKEKHVKAKKNRNERARLEYQIKWYEAAVNRMTGKSNWNSWFINNFRNSLRKYKEEWNRLFGDKND